MRRLYSFCLIVFFGAGCSFGMMAQMAGPSHMESPGKIAHFPEAAPLLRQAAIRYAAARDGRPLRAYFEQSQWEKGHGWRSVPVNLFYETTGGSVVKGGEGEGDRVCYVTGCALVHNYSPGKKSLDCDEDFFKKIYCSDIEKFPIEGSAIGGANGSRSLKKRSRKEASRAQQKDLELKLQKKANYNTNISALSLRSKDGRVIALKRDGRVFFSGKHVSTIHKNGLITETNGRPTFAVDKRGVAWVIERGRVQSFGQFEGTSLRVPIFDITLSVNKKGQIVRTKRSSRGNKTQTSKERMVPSKASRANASVMIALLASQGKLLSW